MYSIDSVNQQQKISEEEFDEYDYIELMNTAFSLDYLLKWNWKKV